MAIKGLPDIDNEGDGKMAIFTPKMLMELGADPRVVTLM